MIRPKVWLACCVALMIGCGGSSGGGSSEEEQFTGEVRGAMPAESQLLVGAEDEFSSATPKRAVARVGETALYPAVAWPIAVTVNTTLKKLFLILEAATLTPPAHVDLAEHEAIWGPFEYTNEDNDQVYGTVWLFAEREFDTDEGAFEYTYVVMRATDDFDPVAETGQYWPIVGVSHYPLLQQGAVMLDFNESALAGAAMEDPGPFETGTFGAVFKREEPQDDPGAQLTWIVAKAMPAARPSDPDSTGELAYLYGQYLSPEPGAPAADFFSFSTTADVDEDNDPGTTTADEDLVVSLAFLSGVGGRAEATATGGDLSATATAVECWSTGLVETYLYLDTGSGITITDPVGGTSDLCVPPFQSSLSELGIPKVDDLSESDTAELDELLGNGLTWAINQ